MRLHFPFLTQNERKSKKINRQLKKCAVVLRCDFNSQRHFIIPTIPQKGWAHEQDNAKFLKKNGKKTLIAQEKGYNTYTRMPDSLCQSAVVYWENNKKYWKKVRKNWAKIFFKEKNIKLKKEFKGEKLMNLLFSFEQEKDVTSQKIENTINNFTELAEN